MKLICRKSTLRGEVTIPPSKSHTIRAVAIGSLAAGESRILDPLESNDTLSAVSTYRAFGAEIQIEEGSWSIRGTGGEAATPSNVIDVGNSGTTLNVALGTASLLRKGLAVLTGDDQVRKRPSGPLIKSLNDLGARAESTRGAGLPPVVVGGRLRGGKTTIEALSSQYVTSLLLATPLSDGDTEITVPVLNEKPYVQMTLDWLSYQGITVKHEGLDRFFVPGGQKYKTVNRRIPADFSSATFFLGAGALGDNRLTLLGLDMNDSQGDKVVVEYIRSMGARVEAREEGILVEAAALAGCEIDLNATPDALPMMAVLATFARGTTRLVNVPQARLKETDRIAVMRQELSCLGANVRELEDGLVIEGSQLHPGHVDGHGDHRVVMALAVAGCSIPRQGSGQVPGETVIEGAEAVSVTFPTFVESMKRLGGDIRLTE